ncbi:ABC-type polysaccharide transport system, permease component [Sphaerochaeta pleomorpha str. Grapes]|uniref:ABC-type polysaccharide transport system, permease component n=2 Tax=Sphaerochaeta TaxID=399320 RepID=G8QVY5_SPHPG|nr:ABC-type polysaccharide transport system, permease component [Sphaerochaeta pleomorpha str. Grapes]
MADLRKKNRLILQHWQLYLLLVFPLVNLIIFKYLPILGLQMAFKDFRVSKGLWGSPWVGLKHFRNFFVSPSFWAIIGNTIIISLYSIIASFPLAIMLAIGMNELSSVFARKTVQFFTYAPYFISTVVLVSMMMQLFDPRIGLLMKLLKTLGYSGDNIFGSPTAFRHLYVWSGIWQQTGYNAIMYLAALSAIDIQLYDAAKVDGCSKWQRIWHIDLPGIQPTIIILLILNMGYIMSVGFEKVYLMQNPMNLGTSEIIATYVYRVGLINSNFGFSTAVGFFNSVVNLILMLSVNKVAQKVGETSLW